MNTKYQAVDLIRKSYISWCASTGRKFSFNIDPDTKQQFKTYLLDRFGVFIDEDIKTLFVVRDQRKFLLMLLAYGS